MRRRDFVASSAASGLVAQAEENQTNQYIEVRFFHVRNSYAQQPKRLVKFLEEHHLPMTKRNELGPVGYFAVTMGAEWPMFSMVLTYDSLSDMETKNRRKFGDRKWMNAADEFGSAKEPPFARMESSLLKAFDGMPRLVPPSHPISTKSSKVFDLRIYQAETFRDVREKVKMFNEGEISLFKKVGINPVFFGQAIIGSKLPNLTYMVWYKDMTARQMAWKKFSDSDEWKKMSSKPEWANEEIVSNISKIQMEALSFSEIR